MRIRRALPLLLLLALALPAAALGNAYTSVEGVYATSGSVPPCRFSSSELEAALKQTPPYDREYFGDFIDAVQTALNQRAAGACGTTGSGRASAAPAGPLPRAPQPPASATSAPGGPLPFPLVLAGCVLAAACLLAAGAWLVRASGADPAWAQALRHSWREAEYRIGGGWEDVRDRLSRSR